MFNFLQVGNVSFRLNFNPIITKPVGSILLPLFYFVTFKCRCLVFQPPPNQASFQISGWPVCIISNVEVVVFFYQSTQ